MMLDHLGETEAAARVDGAVARCLEERRVVTADLGAAPAHLRWETRRRGW